MTASQTRIATFEAGEDLLRRSLQRVVVTRRLDLPINTGFADVVRPASERVLA